MQVQSKWSPIVIYEERSRKGFRSPSEQKTKDQLYFSLLNQAAKLKLTEQDSDTMFLHCTFLGSTVHNKLMGLKYRVRGKGLHLRFLWGHNYVKPRELLPSSILPGSMEAMEKQLTEEESNVLHFIPYALPLTIKAAVFSSKPEQ